MQRYGGCGLIPAGIYQELPTTIFDRRVAADNALIWDLQQVFNTWDQSHRGIRSVNRGFFWLEQISQTTRPSKT